MNLEDFFDSLRGQVKLTKSELLHKKLAKEISLPPIFPPSALPQVPAQDRRQLLSTSAEAAQDPHSIAHSFARYVNGFKMQDIVSAKYYSRDFAETRAEYIALRLRFMAFFYAVVVPLWIPVDYLLLSPAHFHAMIIPKLLLAAILLPFGLLTLRRLSNNQIHFILTLTIVAAGMFYFSSMLILHQGVAEQPLAGYSFMPFMLVSMLGLFPLTITCSVMLISIIMNIYLALATAMGQLMSMETANMLWVFFILGGIALWVQAGQLLMLLKLYRESTQDPLTGMTNRRVLMKRIAIETAHVNAGKPSFCILMFDLDRFKRVNDTYGHLTGDKVLKITAELLQNGLREQDIVARFGGEEFVAVLPRCSSVDAIVIAERIRASCYATQIPAPNGDSIQLSTCVGVTEYEAGEAIDATLNRVDESLYNAKKQGRNRVIHNQSADLPP